MSKLERDIAETFRHPWVRAGLTVGLVALLVVVAYGGFRQAPSVASYPTVGANARVETGPLAVTALCLWTSGSLPGALEPLPGDRYLMLRMRVENLAERNNTVFLSEDVVLLPGGGNAIPAYLAKRSDDHSSSIRLQPRLPSEIDLVWDMQKVGSAPLRELAWGIVGREYRQGRYFDVQPGWEPVGPRAKVVLPTGRPCPHGEGA